MNLKLSFLLLACLTGPIACNKSLSSYDSVRLSAAADGADNAANETEAEIAKIQTINKALEHQVRAR